MIWYILHIPLILVFAYLIRPSGKIEKLYWLGLTFKLMAGIVLGVIYLHWLGEGDTVTFDRKASVLYQLSQQSAGSYLEVLFTPEYPVYKGEARNELFTKLLSIVYCISGGSYWISALYLSLISFLGSWYLVRSIVTTYPKHELIAIFAFLFFPSPVFWSAGVLKDPLVNASIFFLAGICIRYHRNLPFSWWEMALTILALHLLFYLKFYLYALSTFSLGILLWLKIAGFFLRKNFVRYVATLIVLAVGLLLVSRANRNLNFGMLPDAVYQTYQLQIAHSDAEDMLFFPELEPTWNSLLFHFPKGLIAGLFRPSLPEASGYHLGYALENTCVLILLIISLVYSKSGYLKPDTLGYVLAFYILVLATFLPLVAPDFGTLTRYKAAFLPFLVFLVMLIPYRHFLSKRKVI